MRHEHPSFDETFDFGFLIGVWEIVPERWPSPSRQGRRARGSWDDPPPGAFIEFRPDGTGRLRIEGRTRSFEFSRFDDDIPAFTLTFTGRTDEPRMLSRRRDESFAVASAAVVLEDGKLEGHIEWEGGNQERFSSSRRIAPRSRSGAGGAAAWAIALPPWPIAHPEP